jgi:phospholipase A1|tara:strand:- start:6066 stop:6899 length:834 start_codon:yes stop_codon:yes gene_type:complete
MASSKAEIHFNELKDEYNKLLEKKYVLLPHKGTYLLPFSHNDNPNSNTFKTIEDENKDRGTFYERTETEFQISFLILTNKNIFNTNFNTFIGYTHRAYWQVYNKDWSRPFRETNYMPEIFARYVFDKPPKILNAHYIGYDIGFVHQSNGQVQELSRSWNRIFSRFTFLAGSTFFNFTLWYRLPESKDENENPYMYKYRGYGEIDMRHEFGELDLRLRILPGTEHISGEFALSYPWKEGIRFYSKISYGYGISLQDYDHESRRIGLGLILSDPISSTD